MFTFLLPNIFPLEFSNIIFTRLLGTSTKENLSRISILPISLPLTPAVLSKNSMTSLALALSSLPIDKNNLVVSSTFYGFFRVVTV